MFWSAMAWPKDADKLGMIAFQFPPYFIAKGPNFDYLASLLERGPELRYRSSSAIRAGFARRLSVPPR
jgi:uncharacterized protein YecE (DUF72 family)